MFWQMMEHPTEGMLRVSSNPIGLKRTPPSIRRLAPRLGEHTREVLKEFHFDGGEVELLIAGGVARQWAGPSADGPAAVPNQATAEVSPSLANTAPTSSA